MTILHLSWCESCGNAATLIDPDGLLWCNACNPGSDDGCLRLEDAWDGDDQ